MRALGINVIVAGIAFFVSWLIFSSAPISDGEAIEAPAATLIQTRRGESGEQEDVERVGTHVDQEQIQGKIVVDQMALQSLLTGASDARDAVRGPFANLIGVTPEQRKRYEQLLSDLEAKLKQLEKANFSIVRDGQGGNEWVSVKPFKQAGEPLKVDFSSKLEDLFGADIGRLVWHRVKDSDSFGHFGSLETRLSLISEPNTVTGEPIEYFEVQRYSAGGQHLSGTRGPLKNNRFRDRYAHIFPEFSSE